METSQKTQLLHDDAQALALIERIKQKMEETKRAEESSEVGRDAVTAITYTRQIA